MRHAIKIVLLLASIWPLIVAEPAVAQLSGQPKQTTNDAENLAVVEGSVAWLTGDPEKAVAILQPLAEKGNAEAQFSLGLILTAGEGIPKDMKTALS
ncbi:MAG: hypothetical protein ACK5DN_08060, partial [Hyphomonadaceae bacterium]